MILDGPFPRRPFWAIVIALLPVIAAAIFGSR
jgi:hypothetical protein